MKNEEAYLQCKYSNGLGANVEITYTARNDELLTADDVLTAMLDAMAGFGFMQKSIYSAVIDKAYEFEDYLRIVDNE